MRPELTSSLLGFSEFRSAASNGDFPALTQRGKPDPERPLPGSAQGQCLGATRVRSYRPDTTGMILSTANVYEPKLPRGRGC